MIGLSAGLRLHAKLLPDQVAVKDEQRSVTYEEFWAEVERLAARLRGFGTSSLFGLLLGNTIEHLVALFAVDLVGGSVAPLNPHWAPTEVEVWHDELGIALTLTDQKHADRLGRRTVWCLDADVDAQPAPRTVGDVSPSTDPCSSPNSPYLYALTGGTSGLRKSIPISRAATLNRLVAQAIEFGPARKRRMLVSTPLFHGAGRSLALGYLWQGASVQLSTEFDPKTMEAFLSSSCHVTFAVPTMIFDLIDARVQVPVETEFICSGAQLSETVGAKFRHSIAPRMYNYYASVEAGGVAILSPEDADSSDGSVGHVMFGTEIMLVDAERREVEHGEVGEILVRSGSLASGLTLVDGWYATGDLGHLDRSRHLVLHGRKDDRIISGGVNVDPLRVEKVLTELAGVREVAVIGLKDARWGERVVAAYVPITEAALDLATANEYCRSKLVPAECPKEFFSVGQLPRTPVGKLDRKKLRELLSGESRE